MQIEGTTTNAAEVLLILMDAHLRPDKDYHMNSPCLPNPPISFTLHVTPLSEVMRRFRSIPGTVITDGRGA